MNNIFVRAIFNELEMLRENSWDNIESNLKKYNKQKKEHAFEYKYSIFFKRVIFNDITLKEINRFLNLKYKNGKVSDYICVKKDEKENSFIIINRKYDKVFDIDKNIPLIDKLELQFRTFTHNPIINLITIYESFIRQLISYDCFEGNYDIVKNETIPFEKILTLNYDEEEIKDYIIKSYCDSKLYGDKKRILDIVNTLKIDCNDCVDLMNEFNEIYFRRNMYVHSVYEITNDYRTLPSSILDRWIKDGELIDTPQYLDHAFNTVYKIFIMVLIKKYLYKQKDDENLQIIEQIIYEEMYCKKMYSIAKFGYEQLKNLNWISKTQRYRYFINYMHCLKNTDKEMMSKELSKWDTDTDATIYKLAKKLINNDYKNINSLVNKILKNENEYEKLKDEEQSLYILMEDVATWPIFEDYRATENYKILKSQFNI